MKKPHSFSKKIGNISWLLFFFLFIPYPYSAQESNSNSAAETVLTGIQLMNIYDLDMNAHSFHADLYIWFKWKGKRNPTNIEFVNSIDKWSFTQINFYEEPKLLTDGYWYNGMRIEGRFFHPFELEKFPLDKHNLEIIIENSDYPLDSLVFVPDKDAAFKRENLLLPGWNITGVQAASLTTLYPSDFGETGTRELVFSNYTFGLSLARPTNYFWLKLMLPLMVIILVSLGSLFIHPKNSDARISLVIGGLLAAVFLQQSYSSALPDVGYMVLMDKIYLLIYIAIAAMMLRVILSGNNISILKKQADLPSIKRKDKKLALFLFVALMIGIGILVFQN